jgi:hypothetical protein
MDPYLLSTYQPDGPPPPSDEMGDIVRDVAALEEEMKAAGVWVFNDHLEPPSASTVVRIDAGDAVRSDGPYAEGHEHVGGVSIIRVPDRDTALVWAEKMARATTLPIEVRPFLSAAADDR